MVVEKNLSDNRIANQRKTTSSGRHSSVKNNMKLISNEEWY